MKREKSCGALVYRLEDEKLMMLLLKHRKGGHWGFPKGHVELGETEQQTALREIKEETGLSVLLDDRFRQAVEYYPKQGVKKQVVYFVANSQEGELVPQEEEISELVWMEWDDAFRAVTFKNDKNLLSRAKEYLIETGTI